MKRKTALSGIIAGLGLALALTMGPAAPAQAQQTIQGIQWTTGFQVQNLGTGTATATIELINQDGTPAATITNQQIPRNGSNTYFPVPQVSAGFQGSAIISADQPVAAILNVVGTNPGATTAAYNESASGITQGATEVNLPLILRANAGYDTWFAVQNAGTGTASVTVEFRAGGVGNNYTAPAVNIAQGASRVFDQATENNLGARFVGSAIVRSSQPLAVVVNQVGKGNIRNMFTYSGFAGGSNSIALPLIQQANAGTFTGISIQNTGTVPANVTVTYGPNLVAGGANLANDTATLQPGQSTVFLKDNANARYVGSAVVTTGAANQQVVVVVNQTTNRNGSAYEGFSQAAATSSVSLPLLLANNGGYFTGVQCRNVGPNPTNITLTYSPNTVPNNTFTPTAASQANVASGSAANFQQNFGTNRYVGGGVVTTSPASPVVCIVNQLNSAPAAGDAFLTYNGINFQ